MDWSWLLRVAKWAQTQNYKPFHRISREILHRGYKTSFHFRRLSTEIRPTISLETNGSFFLYHIRCLFVFWYRLFFIYIIYASFWFQNICASSKLQTAMSISGTSCKYNFIPLHTEIRLNIYHKTLTTKYNNEEQRTYTTFPVGNTDQHVTFLCIFLLSPKTRKWEFSCPVTVAKNNYFQKQTFESKGDSCSIWFNKYFI